MAAALLLLVLLFLGERCGSYANFQGELDACLGPLLSGRGVTPAPVWDPNLEDTQIELTEGKQK